MKVNHAVIVKVNTDTGRINDEIEYDLRARHYEVVATERKYELFFTKYFSVNNLNDLQKDIEFLVRRGIQATVEIHPYL